MIQQHELEAWLGDDWTPEQIEQIGDDYRAWERDNPDPDSDLAQAVLTAIAQRVDGVLDLAEVSRAELDARRAAAEARTTLRAAVVALDLAGAIGTDPGQTTEKALAEQVGVDRMTIRKWRGK